MPYTNGAHESEASTSSHPDGSASMSEQHAKVQHFIGGRQTIPGCPNNSYRESSTLIMECV